MSMIEFEKVTQLPGVLKPNAVYFVASGTGFDLYVVNDAGTEAKAMNQADTGLDPFLLMGVSNG